MLREVQHQYQKPCPSLSGLAHIQNVGHLLREAVLDSASSCSEWGWSTAVHRVLCSFLLPSWSPSSCPRLQRAWERDGWGVRPGGRPHARGLCIQPGRNSAVWQRDSPGLSRCSAARKGAGTGLMIMNTWACFVFEVLYKHDLINPRGGAAPPKRSLCYSFLSLVEPAAGRACWRGGCARWGSCPPRFPIAPAVLSVGKGRGEAFLTHLTASQLQARETERLSDTSKATQPFRGC